MYLSDTFIPPALARSGDQDLGWFQELLSAGTAYAQSSANKAIAKSNVAIEQARLQTAQIQAQIEAQMRAQKMQSMMPYALIGGVGLLAFLMLNRKRR